MMNLRLGTRIKNMFAVAAMLLFASPALAWGPHPNIGIAAGRALAPHDPFMDCIASNVNVLGGISWMGDWANGADISGVQGVRIYTRDAFAFPGFTPRMPSSAGHGDPESGSYELLFRRVVQAMRTETRHNVICWLGSLLHDTEDTGAPPHAAKIYGRLHGPMENWLDASKIDIAGYEPRLLGRTEDEAVAGYLARMGELHDYAIVRAEKIVPLVEAGNRAAVEPIVLECALESARATADTLHTLGFLHAAMQPIPGSGELAGRIAVAPDPERLTPKIMLMGTAFSTLADLEGNYVFRNLPAGRYTIATMMSGYEPARAEVTVTGGERTAQDLKLQANGNMLRNGGMTVRWADPSTPDGWYLVTRRGGNDWRSEPVFARPGQAFRLQVAWKPGVEAEATVLWRGQRWDDAKTLRSPDRSLVIEAPDDLTQMSRASVYVRSSLPLTDAAARVCLIPLN